MNHYKIVLPAGLIILPVLLMVLSACANRDSASEIMITDQAFDEANPVLQRSAWFTPEERADSTFFLQPDHEYSHFLFRKGDDGKPQRTFVIGVYDNLLHQKHFQTWDPQNFRIPDQELFYTLREHFNLIYTRFTYVRGDVKRPAYYDFLGPGEAFVMGAGHLPWLLRSNYSSEANNQLSLEDQQTLADRIDRDGLSREIQNIVGFAGKSPLIINLIDEPEYGAYGGNWHYSNETLRLMYELASPHGIVSMGLGPVADARGRGQGSQLIWSLENPNSRNPKPTEREIRRGTTKNLSQVLSTIMDYYDGSYDILYLNSYSVKISQPEMAGKIVREMMHHPTVNRQKPAWPWISTENFRYNPEDENTYLNIRRQVFSALANEASGIMFYPDVRVDRGERPGEYDERLWEFTLELATGLNKWRHVLEQGDVVRNYVHEDGNYEWIHYETENQDVVFLASHSNSTISLDDFGGEAVSVPPHESGIWYREKGVERFVRGW